MVHTMRVVFLAVGLLAFAPSVAFAQAMLPWANTDDAINDQNRYNQQQQRLSPRNRVFLAPQYYQQPYQSPTQYYDATTVNKYIMGYPGSGYRVRPLVNDPMYTRPGTGETVE